MVSLMDFQLADGVCLPLRDGFYVPNSPVCESSPLFPATSTLITVPKLASYANICRRPAHSLTLSSATQPEMDEARPQADYGHLQTPIDGDHYHTPRTSRSPSSTMESAPVAEHQEWPFQGFLKRTKIWNETTYNLEFRLPHTRSTSITHSLPKCRTLVLIRRYPQRL